MGLSPKTIRRHIKDGTLEAKIVSGKYGDEYRITELSHEPLDKNPALTLDTPTHLDVIRELQRENIVLAGQLGGALEKIKNLENQVKLLTGAKQPWWKRLFRRRS